MEQEDLVCGINAVLSALKHNAAAIDALWVDSTREDRRIGAVIAAARDAKIKVHRVPGAKLDQLADGERHQGVVARRRDTAAREEKGLVAVLEAAAMPLVLVLDGVQDPQNLGACIRSAAAAGAQAIILPRDHSAPLTAATRRAAAGGSEIVPVFYVANLARTLRELKDKGLWLVAITQEAEQAIYAVDLKGPVALVLGGEGEGIRRLTREHCDFEAHIPMPGEMESLNVSVATGIGLFEAVRQRI